MGEVVENEQDKESVFHCLGRDVRSVYCRRGHEVPVEVRGQALESIFISYLV